MWFQVLFNGVPAITVKRQGETLLTAAVPSGVLNGNLVVQAGYYLMDDSTVA